MAHYPVLYALGANGVTPPDAYRMSAVEMWRECIPMDIDDPDTVMVDRDNVESQQQLSMWSGMVSQPPHISTPQTQLHLEYNSLNYAPFQADEGLMDIDSHLPTQAASYGTYDSLYTWRQKIPLPEYEDDALDFDEDPADYMALDCFSEHSDEPMPSEPDLVDLHQEFSALTIRDASSIELKGREDFVGSFKAPCSESDGSEADSESTLADSDVGTEHSAETSTTLVDHTTDFDDVKPEGWQPASPVDLPAAQAFATSSGCPPGYIKPQAPTQSGNDSYSVVLPHGCSYVDSLPPLLRLGASVVKSAGASVSVSTSSAAHQQSLGLIALLLASEVD